LKPLQEPEPQIPNLNDLTEHSAPPRA
jgi:hypothetical protein